MREKAVQHPNIVTWLVLAIGMLAVLFWSARDVSLTAGQRFWLAVATVALAGLCSWIISWEADEEEAWGEEPPAQQPQDEAESAEESPEQTEPQPISGAGEGEARSSLGASEGSENSEESVGEG